jgi:hypothetical protein
LYQLDTRFSSLSLAPILILNSLYVHTNDRSRGIAALPLRHAAHQKLTSGTIRLILSAPIQKA